MPLSSRASIAERSLAPFAWCVLAFMVLVILEGAIVRATGSGAGCGNHWPLCNGEILPHHPRLATIIEFTHRSMTGVLSTLIAMLAAWIYWKRPVGHPARLAALWVLFFLVTEALLGAVLVKGGYVEFNASNARVLVQCVHFTNTMLLVAALTLTAWSVKPRRFSVPTPSPLLSALTLLSALIAGATGSVAALADTLFPSPSLRAGLLQDFSSTAPLLVRMRWIHPAASLLVVVCTALLCLRSRSRSVVLVAALTGLQCVIGVADVLFLTPVWLQVLHLLGADLFWIALVILSAESWSASSQSAPANITVPA